MLIRQVFNSETTQDLAAEKTKTICSELGSAIRAMLFMASDDRQSKISSVLKDVIDQGAEIKANDFTHKLIRMMVADSVNILNNIQDIEITSKNP